MKLKLSHIVLRSIIFNRLPLLYQFLIIFFLSAVITGSLLTGSSVRKSLELNNAGKLNGTGIVISSGSRYIPASLASRLEQKSGERCEGIIEFNGWVRNFNTGESALNTQVFGIEESFFSFNGTDEDLALSEGEVIINSNLASKLGLTIGDDIILRLAKNSEIPSDSPFSPEDDPYESFVLSVSKILSVTPEANFSLGLSQIQPLNLFISIKEFDNLFNSEVKINRILVHNGENPDIEHINKALSEIFGPEDAGLEIRSIKSGSEIEIISSRIFISENELEAIRSTIPESRPVLSYLANSFELDGKKTPYSFISGLPQDIYKNIPAGDGMIINKWLADDLKAAKGDSIKLGFFVMDNFNNLIERSYTFRIDSIIENTSSISDKNLMPEFPGISGSESCSNWDAGVPIQLDDIREKDEEYWNIYKGTPKALINYEKAAQLWGNNFGPATAIRFPAGISADDIIAQLRGNINPFTTGIVSIPVYTNAIMGAENSVDFSTLFLSLGFFIILSSIILLILVISTHFETRSDQVNTFRALGFSNKRILAIFSLESIIVAGAASIAGAFAGGIIDNLIIGSLNSVWQGAVQTDTLSSYMDVNSLVLGFLSTFIIIVLTIRIQLGRQLKGENVKHVRSTKGFLARNINFVFYGTALVFIILLVLSLYNGTGSTASWFLSGTLLFILLIVGLRLILENISKKRTKSLWPTPSRAYFAYYPSRALTPILFLAAGLFIVIITGANRKSFDTSRLERDGGTGGFLYWVETATPLLLDLNSQRGRYEYNIDNEGLEDLFFLQAKRASGDDASCLNLNQVKSPPLLGLDPDFIISKGSFSFATSLKEAGDPWEALKMEASSNTIYGIIDQTVLQWSLYMKVGDTLKLASESGENLNIIIAGGLESSIFQGHILIGIDNFKAFYPSVSGNNILLVDGDIEKIESYGSMISDRLEQYGVDLQTTSGRLEAFNEVTNTYLTVFLTLGGIGLIMGVLGLGFVMLRNINLRRKEYSLMLACGFTPAKIRKSVLKEYTLILLAGVLIGSLPGPLATLPSIISGATIPWKLISSIIILVVVIGFLTLGIAVRLLINKRLSESLRKE